MIKVFISTSEGQGKRRSDFNWADENEILVVAHECSNDKSNIDGGCGCRRAMSGINSTKSTTTFTVKEMEANEAISAYVDSKYYKSWNRFIKSAELVNDFTSINKIADSFKVGVVLERRGDTIQERSIRTAKI